MFVLVTFWDVAYWLRFVTGNWHAGSLCLTTGSLALVAYIRVARPADHLDILSAGLSGYG
jgi:hypothetical protein